MFLRNICELVVELSDLSMLSRNLLCKLRAAEISSRASEMMPPFLKCFIWLYLLVDSTCRGIGSSTISYRCFRPQLGLCMRTCIGRSMSSCYLPQRTCHIGIAWSHGHPCKDKEINSIQYAFACIFTLFVRNHWCQSGEGSLYIFCWPATWHSTIILVAFHRPLNASGMNAKSALLEQCKLSFLFFTRCPLNGPNLLSFIPLLIL